MAIIKQARMGGKGMGLKALVVGDMHGQMETVWKAVEEERPDLLICVGDWGDPGQIAPQEYQSLLERLTVYTVYGNHDDMELLKALRNRDGSPVLLPHGEFVEVQGVRIAGISGIWAKSRKKPYYITDEEVVTIAQKLAGKNVTILVTHGCPVGLADETPKGTHGGQRCFLDAFKIVNPKAHLCGHLHKPQLRQLKSGQFVLNVGITALGDYAVLEISPENASIVKRIVQSLGKSEVEAL